MLLWVRIRSHRRREDPVTTTAQIHGQCDSRFMAVREAFVENFATRGDVGTAVYVYVEGKTVVDL